MTRRASSSCPPCPLEISPIDFGRADELIEGGLQNARSYLDLLEAGEASTPLAMTMHDHRGPPVAQR